MVAIAKQVGPSRWRESFGRYYEDFQPGLKSLPTGTAKPTRCWANGASLTALPR